MKILTVFALIPLFAACVPATSKDVTRRPQDAKVLQDYAILRPKWPDPLKPAEKYASVNTAVAGGTLSESKGIHGNAMSDIANLGLVLDPGPCSIRVRSGKPPLTSYGRLEFTAQKGKIYRFRAKTDPSLLGRDGTHRWEVYEEDTNKVILRRDAKVGFSPLILH